MQILGIWRRRDGTLRGLSSLCVVLSVGVALNISIGAIDAHAQSTDPSTAPAGWRSAGPSSGEITALGTIRQVVSDRVAGSPSGVHILVDGPLGSFDASLGSSLPKDLLQALSDGGPVQITGTVRSVNGKDYLMARQLTVAGHQVTIRNVNGFLVHNPSGTGTRSQKVQVEGNGGVQ